MSRVYGLYNDDHVLLKACRSLLNKGVRIEDVYSPFPVHGLDKVLGIKWTRLAICAFLYGITGTSLALLGLWFFMIEDWPINIGGKPNFALYQNLPAFIPVTFEFTVLCSAHLMAITYLVRNWTLPGVRARNPHPRTTDDHFAIEIDPGDNSRFGKDELESMLKESGAVEVFEK